jgi:hypothetical protein
MSIGRPPRPIEERTPTWRRACLACREKRRADSSDHDAHEAAVAAAQACLLNMLVH